MIAVVKESATQEQIDHFVAVIADGARPRVTADDGYRNLRVVSAIRQAIATRKVVDVADVDDSGGEG